MLFVNSVLETNSLMFAYMFLYNSSLMVLFWTIFNLVTTKLKTLHGLNGISFNPYYIFLLTVLLLSMAGVPPFIGFFSKLFLLTLLTNNSFFVLYAQFFVILFIGLYFYVQNIRFIHSTNKGTTNQPYLNNERSVLFFYYVSLTVLSFIMGGIFYIDDFLLMFSWLFF